jgi:hypothetical protein
MQKCWKRFIFHVVEMPHDAERRGRHSHAERGNEKPQLFRSFRSADFPIATRSVEAGIPTQSVGTRNLSCFGHFAPRISR